VTRAASCRPAASARQRLLRYNLLARVAILVQASTTASLGWMSPGSLTARLLESGGQIGQAVLVLMTALVVVGWLDVLCNDAAGRRLAAPRRHEHLGYLGLGAVYWAQAMAGAALLEGGAWVLLANYLGAGAVCCWYGWTSAARGGRSHG
jgi:hypothetical protein